MPTDQDDQAVEVGQAFAGAPQRVGWFRFYFEDQRWEWSEQVQRMHGYEPGTVTPTTELVLAHKHPEDRHEVAKTIDEMLRTHRAFSTRHRILDTHGVVHQVVVVGDLLTDPTTWSSARTATTWTSRRRPTGRARTSSPRGSLRSPSTVR